MRYNAFTWFLYGKRRFKRLLRRGPLDELRETISHYYDYSSVTDSFSKILNKKHLSAQNLLDFINSNGTFNGNPAILLSPDVQKFLSNLGVNWENSFSEEDLKKAEAFRELTKSFKPNDRALLGCVLTYLLKFKGLTISDIFDENNKIKSEFYDLLLSKGADYFIDGNINFYFRKNTFSSDFIKKLFGEDVSKFITVVRDGNYKRKSNVDEYFSLIKNLLKKGSLNRNNIKEAFSIDGYYLLVNDKLYELIDPFESTSRPFIQDGKVIPELAKHLTEVELKILESSYYPYYLFMDFRRHVFHDEENETIDFNKVFRLSKSGELMFNEDHFREFIGKINLLHVFEYIEQYNMNLLDEYDYEKLGISRSMFEVLIKISRGNYDSAGVLIDKIFSDGSLLSIDDKKASKLIEVYECLKKHMENSNCKELNKFFCEILGQILNNPDNYEDKLAKIENVFIHNNLPEMAKRFLIYKIMYPEFDFETVKEDMMSPTLSNIDDERRNMVILGDLIRIAAESNNLSLRNYLNTIERGNALYLLITSNEVDIESLDDRNKKILTTFLKHLEAVYNQSKAGREHPVELSGDTKEDLNKLHSLFGTTSRYDLPDRIVRMFGFMGGIKSFEQLKTMMDESKTRADIRGRRYAREGISLEEGDFLKGIGDTQFLYDILQNGSLAKEYLGVGTPGSDQTPCDTDLTRIGKERKVKDRVDNSYSSGWGPIWFVIKNDGRFKVTRDADTKKSSEVCYGKEVFSTGIEWGIRTGFGSCDIDYVIIDPTIKKGDTDNLNEDELKRREMLVEDTKFAIALNGFYIPVYDKNTGKLLFTPEEYDLIRSKMSGLSRYGCEEYTFSSHLDDVPDYNNQKLIEDSNNKRAHINRVVAEAMSERGLRFSSSQSEDLTLGGVDLIDTGSTGRGTNTEITSDFDFIMRIDVREKPEELSKTICAKLGINYEKAVEDGQVLANGNLRLKGVVIPGLEEPVDLDISYVKKDEMDFYSTDECLKDRLENIKRQDPLKYQRVLDNIIFAKKFLKENECYKPAHSPDSTGGLGGVGVENWILQNGGSFTDACRSFLSAALTPDGRMVSFEEFKEKYKVYDFGRNFYGKGFDEFVSDNMREEGYRNMVEACRKYMKGTETRIQDRSTHLTDSLTTDRTVSRN
ncbi:MAG: hypothetical protein IKQ35_05925 [Bacilli bacterium]|nr:hypothetical protein [Bacilli bacterium]